MPVKHLAQAWPNQVFQNLVHKILHLKQLKLLYTIVYLKCCVIIAYIHLIRFSNDYTEILNRKALDENALIEISALRGINQFHSNKLNLQKFISESGAIYKSEQTNANLTSQETEPKVFNSASEFLECIEDSRDSIWLIHIVMNNNENEKSTTCEQSKFLETKTWQQLVDMTKFFRVGTFNCDRDPFFCSLKGWSKPQLALGIVNNNQHKAYTKESIEFMYYSDCRFNQFEHIYDWLQSTLNNRLVSSFNFSKSTVKKMSPDYSALKIFYRKTSKIPLYFSAISLKYNKRAEFYKFSNIDVNYHWKNNDILTKVDTDKTTPIFLVIDDKLCYNYGSNLNELPNFVHLNFFLMFLSPDMNNIFLVSFAVLNAYLLMVLFKYNPSILRQLVSGVMYLCIFNFILFSIWLILQNSTFSWEKTRLVALVNSITNSVLVLTRYITMYNTATKTSLAHLRFVLFYHIYIQPFIAKALYVIFLMLYYFQTKYTHDQKILKSSYESVGLNDDVIGNDEQSKVIVGCQKKHSNILNSSKLQHRSSSSASLNDQITTSNNAVTTSPESSNLEFLTGDSTDIEISVHELLNQINGPTSIWLQSSTYADRLILELPHFQYCKCFYVNLIKCHARDETDIEDSTDCGETEDDEKRKVCECGRNKELNEYLEKNFGEQHLKFRRECSICLDKYSYNCLMVMLPCCHSFHRQCIYEWFMNSVNYKLTCPICRSSYHNNKKII